MAINRQLGRNLHHDSIRGFCLFYSEHLTKYSALLKKTFLLPVHWPLSLSGSIEETFHSVALKMGPMPEERSTVYPIAGFFGPCRALVHLPSCGVTSCDQQPEDVHHTRAAGSGRLGQGCPRTHCSSHHCSCRGFPAHKHVLNGQEACSDFEGGIY